MDRNNELSSSDDDDCKMVLGPQFARKLKRPVNPQTGRVAVKKARNDFNDIVSYLGNSTEFEPKTPQFDAVFEISDINELLDIAPLSESSPSATFNEDQEENTCSVEDCRHNKSSIGEENNNTTTKNGINQIKSETLVNNQASTSKTNVPEPSTEFKVPNPVGPLRSRPVHNSNTKKEQRSASHTNQKQNVLRAKNTGNSATKGANLLESNSSATSKSSHKKMAPSTKTTSLNSTKESENNSSKKSSKSKSSENSMPPNCSKQFRKNPATKKSSNKKSSKKSDTSSESKKSEDASSDFDLIVITNEDSESESNIQTISTAMLANAVVAAKVKVMNEKLNKSVRKLTIGFVKLFTKNAEDIDILGENDDTFTASGRFEVKNKLKRRKYPDGTSTLELHMTILTTIFNSDTSERTKNDHKENEDLNNDQKINETDQKINETDHKITKESDDNDRDNNNERKINREANKRRKIADDTKDQKQNNNRMSKEAHKNERRYVDPNQPSTSKNYDPSCVLAVPSTSKYFGPSEVRGNKMDVDSSNGTEKPVAESENLTVEDLAVPGCNDDLINAEQRQAFKQIKSAVGAWIKQCIDNVPIKKPAQDKDIMHDKVLRALSKKLRLLYNNCYDILRNKKIQIIVPVSEDPNSNKFKPIITLSANNRIQHLKLDGSDTNSEGSVLERDLAVSSDTDVTDTENSKFGNNERENVQNGINHFSGDDEDSFSSQSINCDKDGISSGSEENRASDRDFIKNSSTSQDTLDDTEDLIEMPETNHRKVLNKKEHEARESKDSNNDDMISVQSNQEMDIGKEQYETDQMSSLSGYFGERNNSEGDYGSEEQISYEADIDDLNSSVNEYEDGMSNPINSKDEGGGDCSSDIYYKRKTQDDDECKSESSYQNKESQEIQDDDENQSKDEIEVISSDDNNENSDDDDNSIEKKAIPMEISNESSSDEGLIQNSSNQLQDLEIIPGQHTDIQAMQDAYNDLNRLFLRQHSNGESNISQLHPSQVIHGQYDTVSNDSDVLMNTHDGPINPQQNYNTCMPNQDCAMLDHLAESIRNGENAVQQINNQIQNEQIFPQNFSLNPSCIPKDNTNFYSIIFDQIPSVSNIETLRPSQLLSLYSNQLESENICSPNFMSPERNLIQFSPVNYNQNSSVMQHVLSSEGLSDSLIPNNSSLSASLSPTIQNNFIHPDSARLTASMQTSPSASFHPSTSHNSETQQLNNLTSVIQSPRVQSETTRQSEDLYGSNITTNVTNNFAENHDGSEWALSDSDNSDCNEVISDTPELPLQNGPAREIQGYTRYNRGVINYVESFRGRQSAFQMSTMQDSHRNLWLRQQHQLETMRRHAVQRRPVIRSIPQGRRSHESAVTIPSDPIIRSRLIPHPFNANALFPTPPPQPDILDLRQLPRQGGHRSLIQGNPPTLGSLHIALNELRPPFSMPPTHPEILDLRTGLPGPPTPPVQQQQNRNIQRVYSPIVIEDDDDIDSHVGHWETSPIFYTDNSIRRRIRGALLSTFAGIATGEDDEEDDEEPPTNGMPLQELVDNTTVVFHYDGSQEERCNICLCDYIKNEILRRLPCFHTYHRNCIDQWLSRERRTCPNCRTYLSSHLSFPNTNT